ncbi:hypothetical protein BofuT4_uP126720.1 [Botrytis cinerea T4]|uniref:Uncharacterized protein n=1 Tax=Botryotinia fuckeliana (strain T4) TaxID=999810 RepID=G2YSM6_BOTF4|nr:hypothetical protein BofuT4_uP126720.1 [Botrytis cinerea T4]
MSENHHTFARLNSTPYINQSQVANSSPYHFFKNPEPWYVAAILPKEVYLRIFKLLRNSCLETTGTK